MTKPDPNKIPMPPTPDKVDLFLPITFWSETLMTLDKKIQTLSQNYGYGKVSLTITIHRSLIKEVLFNDEIRIREPLVNEDTESDKNKQKPV